MLAPTTTAQLYRYGAVGYRVGKLPNPGYRLRAEHWEVPVAEACALSDAQGSHTATPETGVENPSQRLRVLLIAFERRIRFVQQKRGLLVCRLAH